VIHFPGLIGKHTVAEQPVGHAGEPGLVIPRLHGNQCQQAAVDLADDLLLDRDRRPGDALDESKHGDSSTRRPTIASAASS
jgi:hypothetical protein